MFLNRFIQYGKNIVKKADVIFGNRVNDLGSRALRNYEVNQVAFICNSERSEIKFENAMS